MPEGTVATETSTPAQSSPAADAAPVSAFGAGAGAEATGGESSVVVGSDGGSWLEALPQELKSEKSLQSFKTAADVAKSYVEASKKMGSAVWLPGEKDSPADKATKLNDLYTKLGRPESADKYGILPPDVRGGVWTDKAHTDFLASAHEAGLSKAQAEKMYAGVGKIANDLVPDFNAEKATTEATLKKDWGDGGYEKHMSYAVRAIKHLGGQELLKSLSSSASGNDPHIIKAFARIGQQMAEDGSLPAASEIFAQTEQTQSQLDAIYQDTKGPYYDKAHPDHQKTVEKVYRLNQYLANGN